MFNPFFPMFPFDTPENIRKPDQIFLIFSGEFKRKHWQEKG